jgi:hypothetical protein
MAQQPIQADKHQPGIYYVDGQQWSVSARRIGAPQRTKHTFISQPFGTELIVTAAGGHKVHVVKAVGKWKLQQCGVC